MVTITSAKMALARLTNDSIASDKRPTEPVRYQASVFSAMVTKATTTDTMRSRGCERQAVSAGDMACIVAQRAQCAHVA
jgi:hypothetical protein